MREIIRVRDDAQERRSLGLTLLLGEEFARETGKEIARWMVYPPPPEIEILHPPIPGRPPRVPRERPPREPVPGVPEFKEVFSRALDRRNESVPHRFDMIKVEGAGRLEELMVRSPSTDFSFLLEVDGKTLINRSYADLAALSQNSQVIDAFAELDEDGNLTGFYVLHIGEIRWRRSAIANIYVTAGTVTFAQPFAPL
ncbi:unnamed protein product, partial [marine sediment metagenome]